jgi:protein phosphatase
MADHILKSLDAAALTDVGRVRQRNEDSCKMLIPPPGSPQETLGAVFMVIDGMGGLGGGDVASQLAIAEISRRYYAFDPDTTQSDDPIDRLRVALQEASELVNAEGPKIGLPRIGATGAGIILNNAGAVLIFNVGDCRVYRIRDGQITRVSRDQSVMEREIEAGLSPERAAQVTRSSAVTAFIGQPVPLQANMEREQTQKGDIYIICSDGLWSLVEADEIAKIVQKTPASTAVRRLIALALKRGGQDNVTAIVVRIGRPPGRAIGFLTRLAAALILAVVLTVGYIGFIAPNQNSQVSVSPVGTAVAVSGTTAATTGATTAATTQATTAATTTQGPTTAAPTRTPSVLPTASPTTTAPPTILPTSTPATIATESATGAQPSADATTIIPIAAAPSETIAPTSAGSALPTVTLNPRIITYTPTTRPTRVSVAPATATLKPTLASTLYTVSGSTSIEARRCADISCPIMVKLEPGSQVEVVGNVTGGRVQGRQGTKWYKIPYKDVFVYVHSSYLELATPTPESGIFKR